MSGYVRYRGRKGGEAQRQYRAPEPARQTRVITTTHDLIELDDLMHPNDCELFEARVDRILDHGDGSLWRDRRRAEQMAAENSRPHQPHVLSVLPASRKAA